MKIVSALAGAVLGLTLFGLVALVGTTLGLPEGPGWAVVGVPFIVVIAYLASIAN